MSKAERRELERSCEGQARAWGQGRGWDQSRVVPGVQVKEVFLGEAVMTHVRCCQQIKYNKDQGWDIVLSKLRFFGDLGRHRSGV